MFNKFSVGYNMNQNKKRRKRTLSGKKLSVKENRNVLHEEVANFLLNLNFTIDQVFTAFNIYKFQTVEEALNVMLKDPEIGKYNHRYIETKEKICKICGQEYGEHFEYNHFQVNEEEVKLNVFRSEDPQTINEVHNSRRENYLEGNHYINLNSVKIEFPQSVIDEFEDPNLCRICFAQKLNYQNKIIFSCNHEFCKNCVTVYLSTKIVSGDVLQIKCLYGGCQRIFTNEEVRSYVNEENWNKYRKFLLQKLKFNQDNLMMINCPNPDCEEVIVTDPFEKEIFVECDSGHKSCSKCFEVGWHEGGRCEKYDNSLLKQIQKVSANTNFKQCPNCSAVIEKNEGCNQMKCLSCNYEFCWLCMKEYTSDHYSIYNFTGCPGMRYRNNNINKQNSCRDNPCVKCLWFLLSCILGIIVVLLIITFFFLFGCPYEFVKCYLEKKFIENDQSDNDFEDEYTEQHQPKDEDEDSDLTCSKIIICIILAVVGLALQPFYLLFYVLYAMMECYRRFGCWIFWASY